MDARRRQYSHILGVFEIYDDRVRVLAVLSTGLIDRDMTLAAARSLWTDLKLRGWYRASEAELNHHQMSHRTLRAPVAISSASSAIFSSLGWSTGILRTDLASACAEKSLILFQATRAGPAWADAAFHR
jgi:hypothetical protein